MSDAGCLALTVLLLSDQTPGRNGKLLEGETEDTVPGTSQSPVHIRAMNSAKTHSMPLEAATPPNQKSKDLFAYLKVFLVLFSCDL